MNKLASLGFGLVLLSGVLACAPTPIPPATPTRTPIPEVAFLPTMTPATLQGLSTPRIAPTPTPRPSPTPFRYTIIEGDTLLAIAFRFGVSVEDILKVNPGVDPGFLSIGTELIIPLDEGLVASIPTPTPVPMLAGQPVCYPTGEAGLWCFITIVNENPTGLEGVTAKITLYNQDGAVLTSREATAPINVIPAGQALPLAAYFPPPVPEGAFARREILGAFQASRVEGRYYPSRVEVSDLEMSTDARQVAVKGRVDMLTEGEDGLEIRQVLVVVLAVAYDETGQVVGMRQWEERTAMDPGQSVPFAVNVFSLGPAIGEVRVFAELRPDYRPPDE